MQCVELDDLWEHHCSNEVERVWVKVSSEEIVLAAGSCVQVAEKDDTLLKALELIQNFLDGPDLRLKLPVRPLAKATV